MQSRLDPSIVYPCIRTVASHDYDLDADSWSYDGRDVFRGARDPGYETLDVYWLYNDDAERIGVAEHDRRDHSKVWVGWFFECPFATWFQEEGWTSTDETIWTRMPTHVYEYCMDYGITTVDKIADLCKRGPWTILTPTSVQSMPAIRDMSKVLFADEDCVLYTPPESSNAWKPPTSVSEEA